MNPFERGKKGLGNFSEYGSRAYHEYLDGVAAAKNEAEKQQRNAYDQAAAGRRKKEQQRELELGPASKRGGTAAVLLIVLYVAAASLFNWIVLGLLVFFLLIVSLWFVSAHGSVVLAGLKGHGTRAAFLRVSRFWLAMGVWSGALALGFWADGQWWGHFPHPKEQLLGQSLSYVCGIKRQFQHRGLGAAVSELSQFNSGQFCEYQTHLTLRQYDIEYSPHSLRFLTEDLQWFGGGVADNFECKPTRSDNLSCTLKPLGAEKLARLRQNLSVIQGTDANHNGIRDEVDGWLKHQVVSDDQEFRLAEFAHALQAAITEPGKINGASYKVVPFGLDQTFRKTAACANKYVSKDVVRALVDKTLDTDLRRLAISQFAHLSYIAVPASSWDFCVEG